MDLIEHDFPRAGLRRIPVQGGRPEGGSGDVAGRADRDGCLFQRKHDRETPAIQDERLAAGEDDVAVIVSLGQPHNSLEARDLLAPGGLKPVNSARGKANGLNFELVSHEQPRMHAHDALIVGTIYGQIARRSLNIRDQSTGQTMISQFMHEL
jgi:hypothetical protein